ncbi:MAG: hypothetical protein Q7R41_15680, partial [Phycisphaerales bacterium]|nr:hypothetical protein [Phycisphaerales bacterium]
SLPTLELGVYTLSEVARYTNLKYSTVRYWFLGRPDGAGRGPVFRSDYPIVCGQRAVSFLDLFDALIAGQFRELGVSLQVVRRAHTLLQRRLGTIHPFCHQDLYTDGKAIIAGTASEINDETLNDVISGQHLFPQIKIHLDHVVYCTKTKLAVRWHVADGVVMDPTLCRGKPVVEPTGTTTFVLSGAYSANDQNADLVADLFDVSIEQVLNAVKFEEALRKRHAA